MSFHANTISTLVIISESTPPVDAMLTRRLERGIYVDAPRIKAGDCQQPLYCTIRIVILV